MTTRACFLLLGIICLASLAGAQQSGRAVEIQESLQSRYRLTRIGSRPLGIGGNENSVRHAGGVVVLRKEGLYGSFKRNQLISMSIIGSKVDVLSGSKESSIPLAVGERFYVVAVSVSSDAVTLGLLSTETKSSGDNSGQLWASLNFFFAKELIQRGDVSLIYPEIDEWLLPEGAGAAPSVATPAPVPTPARPATKEAAPRADTVIDLHNGMTRAEMMTAMGKPEREIAYADRRWMRYPEVTAVLEKDRVIAIENNPGRSSLKVTSEPQGADFYVDGALAGSTPSTIGIPAGEHTITVRQTGFQDWQRELSVLAGSEINLNATLSK